mmetsp:Transcript_12227/g.22612  ORF Transcript_12227/g.22612 Transcript_12227/m.22612 type:complete len:905 (-) Transcript_12227:155-2869(-)
MIVGGTNKYDVSAAEADSEALGHVIAECVAAKGMCVIDADIKPYILKQALEDILQLDAADQFYEPHPLLVDGLLGCDGSSRIAELDVPEQAGNSGDELLQLDELITHLGLLAAPWLPLHLGVEIPTRTFGVVHETGSAADDEVEAAVMPIQQVGRWLYQFVRHKLMCVICIGPEGATLDLNPFDDETEPFSLEMQPGDAVILRPDVMLHTVTATEKTYFLSAFLLEETRSDRRSAEALAQWMTPCAKALDAYAMSCLLEIKEHEDRGVVQQDPLPPEILSTMNHYCFKGQRIAIRGASMRLPSTWSFDLWFQSTLAGADLLTAIPLSRWDNNQYYDPSWDAWRQFKTFCQHGAFMEGLDLFDCKFFGISPAESRSMDPTQRSVLEVGYEALHHAGYTKGSMTAKVGGVYLGSSISDWGAVPKSEQDVQATGGSLAISANRFSYCLGLRGPSIALDNDQAGGLAAVHLGCEATVDKGRGVKNLFSLSGASSIYFTALAQAQLQGLRLFSAVGRCLAFDASADGFVRSESTGFVVAKRFTEVVDGQTKLIEGEPLIGIVAGSAMSHVGRSASMTTPNGADIQGILNDVLNAAGINDFDVDGLEGMGWGHTLVDAIEYSSTARTLRSYEEADPIGLMSTKCFVGSAMDASSIQSFIKALRCGTWGVLPGNLHILQLNPHVQWNDTNNVGSEVVELPFSSSYIGVSAFGIGGCFVNTCVFNKIGEEVVGKALEDEHLWPEQFSFWPGGGGSLDTDSEALKGYHIIGSFTDGAALPMQSGGSTFTFDVTLGEQGWEEFQILMDGNPRKVLYPGEHYARRLSPVYGPDPPDVEDVSDLKWCIDPEAMWSFYEDDGDWFEAPAEPISDDVAKASAAPEGEHRSPKVGEKYRIYFMIAGKYRVVDWQPVKSE